MKKIGRKNFYLTISIFLFPNYCFEKETRKCSPEVTYKVQEEFSILPILECFQFSHGLFGKKFDHQNFIKNHEKIKSV